MRALILAAGTASRLRPLTDSTPKCLLEIGGSAILERTIANLMFFGIKEIIIVTGYLNTQISEFVKTKFPGIKIHFVHNPVYDQTNNIYSLWLARDLVLGQDIVMLDSDIIFDRGIMGLLLGHDQPDTLAMRSQGHIGREEMKVLCDDEGMIREISKEIDPSVATGESIGIEKFSRNFVSVLYEILQMQIVEEKKVNKFYEIAFQEAIDQGHDLHALNVGHLKCIEIDTPDDMSAAQELIRELA